MSTKSSYFRAPSEATRDAGTAGDLSAAVALRRPRTRMLVLDRALRVVSADAGARELLREGFGDGLPATIVRDLMCWVAAGMPAGEARFGPADGLVTRAVVLEGEFAGIGLFVEPASARETLESAAQRFALSARERDVVRHIVDGLSSGEISLALGISEHTVGDYLKRIFAKTGARSRSELVALLLGWRAGAVRSEPDLRKATR